MIERRKPSNTYKWTTPLDDTLSRITTLVRDRKLLREQGVTEAELEQATVEIAKLQWRLASIVQAAQRRQRAACDRRHRRAMAAR